MAIFSHRPFLCPHRAFILDFLFRPHFPNPFGGRLESSDPGKQKDFGLGRGRGPSRGETDTGGSHF